MPEAYRQQFHSSRKQDTQTFTEFAREKEVQFDCWCSAKEVAHNFDKLRQLILLEEFKSCLLPHLKTYLDEWKVDNLHQAAVLADDYSLTHKGTFTKSEHESNGGRAGMLTRNSSGGTYNLRPKLGYADRPSNSDGRRAQKASVHVIIAGEKATSCPSVESWRRRRLSQMH